MKDERNDYQINEDSFKFVNADERIADTKLDTKPTTFARDAFKRFCQNKSSVVASIILGILILLAIFVPVFSPYNIDRVSADEAFLEPKLFEAGTGFWDGTKSYKSGSIMYDRVNETPAGFYKPAVLNLTIDSEPTLINQASAYGSGGYVMFENQNSTSGGSNVTLKSSSFTVTADGGYTASISLKNEADVLGSKLGEYRIYFEAEGVAYVLQDWSKDYSDFTINLSSAAVEAGEPLTGTLTFELKAIEGAYSYILIKDCVITSSVASKANELEAIGFSDATAMVLLSKDEAGNLPAGYWTCTGRKGMYASEVYYCSFVYDTYAAVYDAQEVVYSKSELEAYINSGMCTYDSSVGEESYKKLDDSCPIEYVVSQKVNSKTGKLLEVTVMANRYSKLGYDEMPKFLLGTDSTGVDVFTRMFSGLRTSLILGFCTFLFCFFFGLVWGSISGYFGGAVDLMMERFCDILGGVPWIVVMTLCILHFGNNFFTFFLALCLTGWMGTSARTRTQFYRFKGREYVLASRTLGAKDRRLIFKHILPNSLGTIVTSSVLMIPSVIFSESTLAYLNLGLQGVASFGVMLANNQQYIQSHSYLIVFPSVVMALLMITFNLFGNGLRDALNPTLKGS